MKRWGLHICPLDRDCRSVGAPPRVHIFTPWGSLTVALTPDARVQSRPYDYEHMTFVRWDRPRRRP